MRILTTMRPTIGGECFKAITNTNRLGKAIINGTQLARVHFVYSHAVENIFLMIGYFNCN